MMERLLAMIRPGRVRLVDDGDVVQRLQIDEGPVAPTGARRIIDRVKMVGLYGFWSVPPIDSEALVVGLAGDRSRSIAIGTNHQASRPTGGQPGDSGIYDVRGARVSLTADGLLIDCAGLPALIHNASTVTLVAAEKIVLDAPIVEVTHDLKVGGNAQAGGNLQGQAIYGREGAIELGALHDAYDGHAHTGVKAGTDTSGPTNQKV